MKHPFMTKESNMEYQSGHKNLAEVSIDSGRGTMSTGVMSRMSNAPKPRPLPAMHHLQSNIPEDRENSAGDCDRSADGYYSSGNMGGRKDLTPMANGQGVRHQQRREDDRIFPDKYGTPKAEPGSCSNTPRVQHHERFYDSVGTPLGDRTNNNAEQTPKTNQGAEFVSRGGDTGYCSASRHSNHSGAEVRQQSARTVDMPRLNLAQFDPTKYQERMPAQSTSSSGWSCSASLHSNDAKVISPRDHTDTSTQDSARRQPPTCISAVSDVSSLDGGEFSLQNTKKVLSFNSESQPTSLTEHYSHPDDIHGPVSHNHMHATNSGSTEFSNQRMYARSNSVDELEFDRPRHKAANMRSNSCDDLDCEESRECSRRPVSGKTREHRNVKCAMGEQSDCIEGAKSGASSKQSTEQGSPINSTRLRPIRQRTRNAVVNILESGEVCLEFVKQKHKEERVVEVFVISNDGMQVNQSSVFLLSLSDFDLI